MRYLPRLIAVVIENGPRLRRLKISKGHYFRIMEDLMVFFQLLHDDAR